MAQPGGILEPGKGAGTMESPVRNAAVKMMRPSAPQVPPRGVGAAAVR